MLNKRILFIFFLSVIALGLMSSVSATDLADNQTVDEIGIEDIEITDLNDVISNSDEDALGADAGTFTALQNKISNAAEGSTIYLDNDYSYNKNFVKTGLKITKSLTVEGNGHMIDGLSKSALLQISNAGTVVIKNVRFLNGVPNTNDEVICVSDVENVIFEGCSFINNSGTYGGAVQLIQIDSSSFINCDFLSNYADYAGAVYSYYGGNTLFTGCRFDKNEAEYVGAIIIRNDEHTSFDSCTFINGSAWNGGAVYLNNAFDCQFNHCQFDHNLAYYGGVIYGEGSKASFKNSNFNYSKSYSYGGAVACKNSDVDVDNCTFLYYYSLQNSGGAIYNLKGNMTCTESSFIGGYASYGGAISNLESDLRVSACKFINNSAGIGGAIYNIYGIAQVRNSFFNNSHADVGGAICCMLSSSLVFTGNVFLNTTSGTGPAIYVLYSGNDVVESENHFEDVYKMYIEYAAYVNGEKIIVKSKVLNYILSNTGTFLNSYPNFDDYGDSSDLVKLVFSDPDYPDKSTIYADYSIDVVPKFNVICNYDSNDNVENETLYLHVSNGYGQDLFYAEATDIPYLLQLDPPFDYVFEPRMFSKDMSINLNGGSTLEAVSLINSSLSGMSYIPSYYNSKDYGYVTSVKNQGDAGNCWAFAGLATLETCIKKATNLACDFSEENAKNLMAMYSVIGLNLNTNNGGYDSMLMAYLTNWLGPISDTGDEQYDSYSLLSQFYAPMVHVQNILFLPPRENSADNDLYKKAIMDYGAVSITFDWPRSGLHAVSLVGWNDNYNGYDSLGNYAKGVWIFKNSWGSSWGDNGYGYLSYNTPLASDNYEYCHAYTFIFNENDSYLFSYQHDSAGVSDYLTSNGHVYYKNKFVTNNGGYRGQLEYLTAFSTYFKSPTDYKVSVYLNDTLVLTQNGHSDAGYYTIPFTEAIPVPSGDEFTIMVENCNSGVNMFPVCQSDELNRANFQPNVSFVSFDGETWLDLYNLNDYYEFLYGGVETRTSQVACIKAFMSKKKLYKASIDVSQFSSIDLNEKTTVDVTITAEDYYFDTLRVINQTLISININGKNYYGVINNGMASVSVSFDNAGSYTAIVQLKNNLFESNIVKFNFVVNKRNTVVSANAVSKVYGSGENSIITLKDDKGNLIANEVVIFTLNGQSTPVKTNAKGQAVIPINLAPQSYKFTITFPGNGNYIGSSTTVNIVVKKATPKITAKKKTYKLKAKKKKYSITLKDNLGRAIKGAKVTVKIKKKTFRATTNAKGKATFKLKLTKKGNYKATVKYAGNAFYNPVSKNIKIKVK